MTATAAIPPRMATMIAMHRFANEVMVDASHEEDMLRTQSASDAFAKANKAEDVALQALLKHRPTSMREATDRLDYLFSKEGPWHDFHPSKTESDWVIASMREAEVVQVNDRIGATDQALKTIETAARDAAKGKL